MKRALASKQLNYYVIILGEQKHQYTPPCVSPLCVSDLAGASGGQKEGNVFRQRVEEADQS